MDFQLNLDQPALFHELDSQNLLAWIDGLPGQLEDAYRAGLAARMPQIESIHAVVLTGVGDSVIAADLFAAYAASKCRLPIFVHRDYGLPDWAQGDDVLVVALSLSGNEEETLTAVETARRNGCTLLVLSNGGQIAGLAEGLDTPVWKLDFNGPAHMATGWFFGLLCALFFRLRFIPDPAAELMAALESMQAQQAQIGAEVPTRRNPAKRMAAQVVGRWVCVFGSGPLAVVARHWKNQVSEIAKAWAQCEALPEADYNTLEGVNNPPELMTNTYAIFLHGSHDHPRNQMRTQLTRQALMLEGLPTDIISARGTSQMEQMWTVLHYGDYFAYYLAMIYGVDPNSTDRIGGIQDEMAA